MHSWLPIPAESDFSIHNLPYGIFHYGDGQARAGMAIGDHIIDLVKAAEAGLLGKRRFFIKIFAQSTLNEFIGLGKPVTNRVRRKVQEWLCLASRPDNAEQILTGRRSATMLLPVRVGNYTDFYSSIEHATNVGKITSSVAQIWLVAMICCNCASSVNNLTRLRAASAVKTVEGQNDQ